MPSIQHRTGETARSEGDNGVYEANGRGSEVWLWQAVVRHRKRRGMSSASFCPVYWQTVRRDEERRLQRAVRRGAAAERLRRWRRKGRKLWQFSLASMLLVVSLLCVLLAGPAGRSLRQLHLAATFRAAVHLTLPAGGGRVVRRPAFPGHSRRSATMQPSREIKRSH